MLWLGSRTSWTDPPVCTIQIAVRVQPNAHEQVKLGSIAHFTRWSLTNIPQSAWSHPLNSTLAIDQRCRALSTCLSLFFQMIVFLDKESKNCVFGQTQPVPVNSFLFSLPGLSVLRPSGQWDMRRSMPLWWLFTFCPVFLHLRARVGVHRMTVLVGSIVSYSQRKPDLEMEIS